MYMFNALIAASTAGRYPLHEGQRGQATAEYALVILGAAAVAALFLAWATSTGRVSRLLNAVLDAVIGQVG